MQEVFGVADKLLLDPERTHDQHLPPLMCVDNTAPFELHDRLAKPECGEYCPAPALHCPHDCIPLMWFQYGADLFRINGNAAFFGNHHL